MQLTKIELKFLFKVYFKHVFLDVSKYYNTTGQHLKISLIALRLRDVTKVNGGMVSVIILCHCPFKCNLHTISMPLLTERA